MVITYQIVLIIMILISFFGVIGEKENEKLRGNLTAVCIAATISFLFSTFL